MCPSNTSTLSLPADIPGPSLRLLVRLGCVESLAEIHPTVGFQDTRPLNDLVAAVVQAHTLRMPVPEHLSYLRNLEPLPVLLLFLLPTEPSVPVRNLPFCMIRFESSRHSHRHFHLDRTTDIMEARNPALCAGRRHAPPPCSRSRTPRGPYPR